MSIGLFSPRLFLTPAERLLPLCTETNSQTGLRFNHIEGLIDQLSLIINAGPTGTMGYEYSLNLRKLTGIP